MTHSFSIEEIQEVKKCMDPITGPEYFLTTYFMVSNPAGHVLLSMHKYQRDYLHNIHSNRKSINLLARQLGKTTMLAGYALWYSIFYINRSTLITSCSTHHCQFILDKIAYAYNHLPTFLKIATYVQNKSQISFENGSTIRSSTISNSTSRGLTISLLLIDELAFANKNVASEMFQSIIPALSSHGKLIISSSYNTAHDVFGELWNDALSGANDMSPFEAKWYDDPSRDITWAVKQEITIGHEAFSREHMNLQSQEA